MSLNSWSFCLSFPSVGSADMCHHIWLRKEKKCKKYVVLKLGLWKLIPFEISWRTLREHNSYTLKRQKQHSNCKQTNTKAKTCEDFLFTNLSLNDMVFKVLYVDVIFCTVPLSLSTLQLESYCGFYCSKCSLERFLMCSGKQLSNKWMSVLIKIMLKPQSVSLMSVICRIYSVPGQMIKMEVLSGGWTHVLREQLLMATEWMVPFLCVFSSAPMQKCHGELFGSISITTVSSNSKE